MTTLNCISQADLLDIDSTLIKNNPEKRVFAFYGKMGAGKTTFIKEVCKFLKVSDVVSSPSFGVINIYKTIDESEIYHFDFYRIKNISEVYDIGYEEYFFSGNYCFIEWPEKIDNLLPEDSVKVLIETSESSNNRVFTF